tara:strand:+ start:13116 stop:13403 length:288 start_codon:yes stop_codon:yes gene_type:complete
MKELIENPWLSGVAVTISQTIFLYLRTLNVMYTAERKLLATLLTGNGIALMWLFSLSLGMNAMMEGQWQPIVGNLVGGSIGVIMSFRTKKSMDAK